MVSWKNKDVVRNRSGNLRVIYVLARHPTPIPSGHFSARAKNTFYSIHSRRSMKFPMQTEDYLIFASKVNRCEIPRSIHPNLQRHEPISRYESV